MAEQALEPMELEAVRNVLAKYRKKKGLSADDAESSAVAAGELVRRPDGSLAPRGWKPAASRLAPAAPAPAAPAAPAYQADPNDPRVKQIREEEERKKQRKRGVGQFIQGGK